MKSAGHGMKIGDENNDQVRSWNEQQVESREEKTPIPQFEFSDNQEFSNLTAVVSFRMEGLTEGKKVNLEPLNEKQLVPPMNALMGQLSEEWQLSYAERMLLSVVFAAWDTPEQMDGFMVRNPATGKKFREIGGVIDRESTQFIPTLKTILFLLAGIDKMVFSSYLTSLEQSILFREGVIHKRPNGRHDHFVPGYALHLDMAWYRHFLTGSAPVIEENEDFPASLLTTTKRLDHLVLNEATWDQLQGPINFLKHQSTLYQEGGAPELHPGYVALFYGPPGTGKTFTVTVLGNYLDLPVYRINLARVISKYIGETEKNLEKVFDRLQDKKAILFFDEADALFGKRSEVTDAKDRYANQEVAYLLQKVEQCSGLVILATNYERNLDTAFRRRILSLVYFATPAFAERKTLWDQSLPTGFHFDPPELFERLAEDYQLTGANIANIVKLSCIEALNRETSALTFELIEPFLKREFLKDNKVYQVQKDRKGRANQEGPSKRYSLDQIKSKKRVTSQESIEIMRARLREYKIKQQRDQQ